MQCICCNQLNDSANLSLYTKCLNLKQFICLDPCCCGLLKIYNTILQNDNITIPGDFLRLTAPAAMPGHIDAVSDEKIS